MPDLFKIRKEALNDIVKDIKVMKKVCYPNEETGVDCRNCEHFEMCSIIFGSSTPENILNKLKEKGII